VTEDQINELQRRLLSFCSQLAKAEDDPVRDQIRELCQLGILAAKDTDENAIWDKNAIRFLTRSDPLKEWPECEEFYNLMQQYRQTPHTDQEGVVAAYEAVKVWIRQL
jgi:hypothetical protein